MPSFGDMKFQARNALHGNWKMALLVAILYDLISAVAFGIVGSQIEVKTRADAVFTAIVLLVLAFWFLAATHLLLTVAIQVGYAQFYLNLVDCGMVSVSVLFEYFRDWWTVARAMGLRFLRISLWGLLFVVPGIIAAYDYALVPYILADEPTLSAGEALRQSKLMMYGHRRQLFILQLSFVGWYLLSFLTCGFVSLWTSVYMKSTIAIFYRNLPLPKKVTLAH